MVERLLDPDPARRGEPHLILRAFVDLVPATADRDRRGRPSTWPAEASPAGCLRADARRGRD